MTDRELTPDEEKMFIALYGKDYFLELKMPKKITARAYLKQKREANKYNPYQDSIKYLGDR